VSGEVSWTGWDWSLSAQTTDLQERAEPLNMAGLTPKREDGLSAGARVNRGINVGFATSEERRAKDPSSPADPDVLPGTSNVYVPDGPGGEEGRAAIWDAALRRGLAVRSWGRLDRWFASAAARSLRPEA